MLEPVLLVECPRLLFPFARNILAEVTRDGGFPPVMLAPIDFVALWQSAAAGRPAPSAPPEAARLRPGRAWPPCPAVSGGTGSARPKERARNRPARA